MDEPDLNFDIDALFAHLRDNLDHDPDEEQDWHFVLSSKDFPALEKVAGDLEKEFTVHLQEHVEEVGIDGNVERGDPILIVIQSGALTIDEVKQTSQKIQSLAEEHGFTYEGVECYDSIDDEELFGWIAPDEAGWRLRNMTDCGVPENSDLPWTFLVATPTFDAAEKIASALAKTRLEDHDLYDEPDDDGNFGLCVFVEGRNNEFELNETAEKISEIAKPEGGSLVGIQFYTREDVSEVFDSEAD
ncbi:MAG: ribonuclease E inhibitor RraB [Planctomycetota bacterium]